MPKILKPTKKPSNGLPKFHESLVQTLPQVPEMKKLTDKQLRTALYIMWGGATVLAGGAIGLLINRSQTQAPIAVSPTPVTQVSLAVSSVSTGSLLAVAATQQQSSLKIVPATSVDQATAGSPLTTELLASYQGAQSPNALDPGYINDGALQGTIGTASVE
jgi:hypothetical protein